MTIEQRTERFFNPGGSTPVGAPVTAVPFADLPNPADAPGQIRTISDVGPAPGIELVSDGSRWRPRGGRQVLAKRTINPVTVQDTTPGGTLVEAIGPFPGGLVKARMTLDLKVRVSSGAISTAARNWLLKIGPTSFRQYSTGANAAVLNGYIQGSIDVLTDTNGLHSPFLFSDSDYRLAISNTSDFSADFSADWSAGIYAQSANEDPINIASASWSAGIATFNTSAAHTLTVGDKTVIAGVTPAGYNGTYIVDTVPDSDTFTAALAADPGAYVSGGTSSRVSNMISQSYVLELIG